MSLGVITTASLGLAALKIILKDNVSVEESDESKPGVILDYDKEGSLVSLEVLDASERVSETRKIEFQTSA